MEIEFKHELTERLIRYAAIDSQSDELSDKSPSTDQQLDMLNLLKDCLLYTSPSPRDKRQSRMPSSA